MDTTHLHLLLNHIPILGTLFGFCLLLYGLFRKNRSLENAGLTTLVVVTLLAIPVFFTGEEAEDTIEHLPGVSELYLEEHEELAEVALWFMITTGILALITLILSLMRDRRNRVLNSITLLAAIATFGVMIAVGNYGGKIRHSELRNDIPSENRQIIKSSGHEHEHEYENDD